MKSPPDLLKSLTITLLLATAPTLHADLFPDCVIGPESRVDWVLTGVEGGIPEAPANEINVLEYGGFDNTGATDNAAALQGLINSLEEPAVIYFPTGEYLMNAAIVIEIGEAPAVVIRGAGATETEFIFRDYETATLFQVKGKVMPGPANYLIKPPGKGSHVLYPNKVEDLEPGDYVHLIQENKLLGFNSMEPGNLNEEYLFEYEFGWGQQATGQIFKIVAIEDGKLLVDDETSLDYDWGGAFIEQIFPMEGVGFENFKVSNAQEGVNGIFSFGQAANCWLTGIHSEMTTTIHVGIGESRNITIYGCYFDNSYDHGGGGRGYGVDTGTHVSNCRVENNIFEHLRHSMIAQLGPNGNVFSYNYSLNGIQDETPIAVDLSGHGFYVNTTLYEGNIAQRAGNSDYWGPDGNFNTYFRNWIYLDNILMDDNTNYTNCIGNVLTEGVIHSSHGSSFTFEHGNYYDGQVQWAEGADESVIDSLIYHEKPGWWVIDDPWPSIGPEYPETPYTIPAKHRYEQGQLTLDTVEGFAPWPEDKYIRNSYLPTAYRGLEYRNGLVLANAEGTVSWTETSDVLSGLGLELKESGLFSGAAMKPGTYIIEVEATDESGIPVNGSLELVVENPPAIVLEDDTAPWGAVNIPYDYEIATLNLYGNAVFSVDASSLPAGLEIEEDGDIKGTPLEAGTFPVILNIHDDDVAGSEVQIPLEIHIQPYTVSENLLPNGEFEVGENGLEGWGFGAYEGAEWEQSVTDDADTTFVGLITNPTDVYWYIQLQTYFQTQRGNIYAIYLSLGSTVPDGRITWALQEVGGDWRVRTSGTIGGWESESTMYGPLYYEAGSTDENLRLTFNLGEMPTNEPFYIDHVLVRRIVDNGIAVRGAFLKDQHAGNEFFYNEWFGYYYSKLPYLWHPKLGWLYMYPYGNVNRVYFYSFATGNCIFTRKSIAPWCWDYANNQWLSLE